MFHIYSGCPPPSPHSLISPHPNQNLSDPRHSSWLANNKTFSRRFLFFCCFFSPVGADVSVFACVIMSVSAGGCFACIQGHCLRVSFWGEQQEQEEEKKEAPGVEKILESTLILSQFKLYTHTHTHHLGDCILSGAFCQHSTADIKHRQCREGTTLPWCLDHTKTKKHSWFVLQWTVTSKRAELSPLSPKLVN